MSIKHSLAQLGLSLGLDTLYQLGRDLEDTAGRFAARYYFSQLTTLILGFVIGASAFVAALIMGVMWVSPDLLPPTMYEALWVDLGIFAISVIIAFAAHRKIHSEVQWQTQRMLTSKLNTFVAGLAAQFGSADRSQVTPHPDNASQTAVGDDRSIQDRMDKLETSLHLIIEALQDLRVEENHQRHRPKKPAHGGFVHPPQEQHH